jgi:N-acetylglucosamine-6-sulfatase
MLLAACEGAGGGGGGTNPPPAGGGGNPPPGGERYNIVVIYTDDQRWDTAGADIMATMNNRLQSHGAVRFNNAYVTTPLCCPSRASIYSGGLYAHRTGVLSNDAPNGGVDQFVDLSSMGKVLNDIGYQTMFIGKYFSSYANSSYTHGSPYIPPGWTQFVGRSSFTDDPAGWANFKYTTGNSENGATTGAEARVGQYTVNYERDRIKDFIDQQQPDEPFYIFMSTTAPHPPARPMADDQGTFAGFTHNVPSRNEADLGDKPNWVAAWPSTSEGQSADNSITFARRQLETLQSVDRAIGVIIDRLQARGLLDNTMFVFTSDNGFLGQRFSLGRTWTLG